MAIYRNGATGKITLFVQEPEDEVMAIRFIRMHTPGVSRQERRYWANKAKVCPSLEAEALDLIGGYGIKEIIQVRNKETI